MQIRDGRYPAMNRITLMTFDSTVIYRPFGRILLKIGKLRLLLAHSTTIIPVPGFLSDRIVSNRTLKKYARSDHRTRCPSSIDQEEIYILFLHPAATKRQGSPVLPFRFAASINEGGIAAIGIALGHVNSIYCHIRNAGPIFIWGSRLLPQTRPKFRPTDLSTATNMLPKSLQAICIYSGLFSPHCLLSGIKINRMDINK